MEQRQRGGANKTLRKRLQRQLEFYLSASNLRQDKFLQQNMDDDGFIAIELFLAFNKLKAMKVTEKMIRDAVEKSALVRISADRSAIAPVELSFDTEDQSQGETVRETRAAGASSTCSRSFTDGLHIERTVYIENFSVDDDHDSLRKLLSRFGKVNLVSMPRFPQSKRFKGFAFVEFASTQAAGDAVKAAHAAEPELKGIRAMSKARWQEMKRQLKEQLAAAAPHPAEAEQLSGTRGATGQDKKGDVANTTSNPALASATEKHRHTKTGKRKTGGDHIHFRDMEDGADEEVEPIVSEGKKQKR